MTTESAEEAYARGMQQGRIVARLDGHDADLDTLNGLLKRVIAVQESLTLTVQTLTQARGTDAETRIATAQAVKDAKEVTEAQAHMGWSPITRLAVIASLVLTVIVIFQSFAPPPLLN